jgi:haloalkane dehalogenase
MIMTPTRTFGLAVLALLMTSLWALPAPAQTSPILLPEEAVPDTAHAVASAALPYPSRFVEVHGIRMHYIDEGEGDPILFLHGNPDHLYVWRNLIPYAARVGRAIAVDLAGMGRSDVPDGPLRFFDHARYLEGFIDALGLHNITLVVHDWGGTLGFDYAHRHEHNVRGLMFMETALGPVATWEAFPAAARAAFKQFRTADVGRDLIVQQNAMGDGPRTVRVLTETERVHYRKPLDEPVRREPVWRFINEIPIAG